MAAIKPTSLCPSSRKNPTYVIDGWRQNHNNLASLCNWRTHGTMDAIRLLRFATVYRICDSISALIYCQKSCSRRSLQSKWIRLCLWHLSEMVLWCIGLRALHPKGIHIRTNNKSTIALCIFTSMWSPHAGQYNSTSITSCSCLHTANDLRRYSGDNSRAALMTSCFGKDISVIDIVIYETKLALLTVLRYK